MRSTLALAVALFLIGAACASPTQVRLYREHHYGRSTESLFGLRVKVESIEYATPTGQVTVPIVPCSPHCLESTENTIILPDKNFKLVWAIVNEGGNPVWVYSDEFVSLDIEELDVNGLSRALDNMRGLPQALDRLPCNITTQKGYRLLKPGGKLSRKFTMPSSSEIKMVPGTAYLLRMHYYDPVDADDTYKLDERLRGGIVITKGSTSSEPVRLRVRN